MIEKSADIVASYIKKTGQSRQEVFSGSQFFGTDFIYELLQIALKENKKILWKDEPEKGLGFMSYSLQDI